MEHEKAYYSADLPNTHLPQIPSPTRASAGHDMSLIGELYETIEQNPPALVARTILMQHWHQSGYKDAAAGIAREILNLDPNNLDAKALLLTLKPGLSRARGFSATQRNRSPTKSPNAAPSHADHSPVRGQTSLPFLPADLLVTNADLSQRYKTLQARAKTLLEETRVVHALQLQKVPTWKPSFHQDNQILDLKNLSQGKFSAALTGQTPKSVRALARAMQADSKHALDIATADLICVARWLQNTSPTPTSKDTIRDRLSKRIIALQSALPANDSHLQQAAAAALIHAQKEALERKYANTETMFGDPITDIPRSQFWVSEDNYAFDMEELTRALECGSGVMRNPLTLQMFTPNDIRAIMGHPLAASLAPLQVAQNQMIKGIRPATVYELEHLSSALLADQSEHQTHSRTAIDAFLAHVATLPLLEQNAIDSLRVPATDSHTGQPFDGTIGEAVRDAQGNRVCMHKTGDFVGQAAQYLRARIH